MASTSGVTVGRRSAVLAGFLGVAIAALLAFTSAARAAELLYWNNYGANQIAGANVDGTGGGLVNIGAAGVLSPEGMAIDTAGGRLFVASAGETGVNEKGFISAINLNGTGASVFAPPGAPVDVPEGIVIDPATQMVYWANTGTAPSKGSIAWAKLDGSAGGILNTAGTTVDAPYRIALDAVSGRVFWANSGPKVETIGFANANNTGGGGTLSTTGATPPESITGFAVDHAAGRIYWIENDKKIVSFALLAGTGGVDLGLSGSPSAYGLALDPLLEKFYLTNYSGAKNPAGAIRTLTVGGIAGQINIATTPVDYPQDPQILKSPTGTGVPALARSKTARSTLECSTGTWAADFAESFVYQAPTTYTYAWTNDGKPVPGASTAKLSAKKPGKYACVVTAANQAGAASQTSAAATVNAAKARLTVKKKASALPGKLATFSVKAVNQGDLKSGNAKLCVKLSKSARAVLKAPKCKALGKLNGSGKRSAKVKIKVLPTAVAGTYGVTFLLKGVSGKAAKAKIVVK